MRLDVRGGEGHPAVSLDELDGQLIYRGERSPRRGSPLFAFDDVATSPKLTTDR